MANKRIDYDGMIRLYHDINKQRELLPHETERLVKLMKLKQNAESVRLYREKNKETLDAKRRQWAKDNPERNRESARRYRKNNPTRSREACRRWREKNPDKVKTI